MARIGLIVEGRTDFEVLAALLQARLGETATPVALQPKFDRTRPAPTGWSGVQQYLARKGRDLAALMRWAGFCALLLQVDGDVVAQREPCSARAVWEAAEARLRAWAGLDAWPEGVFPVIPVLCLETWIAAATPRYPQRTPALECTPCAQLRAAWPDPEERNALEARQTRAYREKFGPRVVQHWDEVQQVCPQAAGALTRVMEDLPGRCER